LSSVDFLATVKQVTLDVTDMDKINIVSSQAVFVCRPLARTDARSLSRHWSTASWNIDCSRL